MFGYTGDAFTSGRPASAAFSVAATERAGLLSTSLSLSGVTGNVKLGDQDVALKNLAFDAAYDPASKKVTLEIARPRKRLAQRPVQRRIGRDRHHEGRGDAPTPFKLSGQGVTVNARPVFENAWQFQTASLQGALSIDQQRLTLSRLDAVTGGLTASGSGEVWLDMSDKKLGVGVKGAATGTGTITPQQVLDFWPQELSLSARACACASASPRARPTRRSSPSTGRRAPTRRASCRTSTSRSNSMSRTRQSWWSATCRRFPASTASDI